MPYVGDTCGDAVDPVARKKACGDKGRDGTSAKDRRRMVRNRGALCLTTGEWVVFESYRTKCRLFFLLLEGVPRYSHGRCFVIVLGVGVDVEETVSSERDSGQPSPFTLLPVLKPVRPCAVCSCLLEGGGPLLTKGVGS